MKCSNCGSKIANSDLFCPNCGYKINVEKFNVSKAILMGILFAIISSVIPSIVYLIDGIGGIRPNETLVFVLGLFNLVFPASVLIFTPIVMYLSHVNKNS